MQLDCFAEAGHAELESRKHLFSYELESSLTSLTEESADGALVQVVMSSSIKRAHHIHSLPPLIGKSTVMTIHAVGCLLS